MRRSSRAATAALGLTLAGALIALGGCGSDPTPSPTPSKSPPSSVAPTSTAASPTPPAMPDRAKRNTKAGAVAFVRYYVKVFNHAQATGDVSVLKTLGTKACVSCLAVAGAISEVYGSGGHSEGGLLIIDSTEANRSENGMWRVDLAGHFTSSEHYPSEGSKPRHIDGAKTISTFQVRYSHGWKVTEWSRV